MVAGPRTSHAGVLIRKGASGYCVTSEGSGGTLLRESTCSELASEWPSQAGGSFSLRVISGISNSQFTAHGPPQSSKTLRNISPLGFSSRLQIQAAWKGFSQPLGFPLPVLFK